MTFCTDYNLNLFDVHYIKISKLILMLEATISKVGKWVSSFHFYDTNYNASMDTNFKQSFKCDAMGKKGT